MSYVHPKRKLLDTDLLLPDLLNADFIPAAENASGFVNEHNITASAVPGSKLGQECFSKQYYAVNGDDANFGSGAYPYDYANPSTGSLNGINVPNTGEWTTITDATQTLTSGSDVLHIMAMAQYCMQTWNAGGTALTAGTTSSANLQFGIRVDGVIHAYTGTPSPTYKTFYPVRAVAQRTATDRRPGPATPRSNLAYSSGLGAYANGCYIEDLIPVAPGTHLVELCVRRMPTVTGYYASTNYVRIYTRKLYIEQIWQWPSAVSTFSGVSVAPFESEDTFSAAAIGTDRVNAIRSAYNDVQSGMIRRGSLSEQHLNTTVLLENSAYAFIDGASYTDTGYPGYGTSTITAARGAAGWWQVEDGAGKKLRTDTSHAASYALAGKNCLVRVDAELNVSSIAAEGAATIEQPSSFGWIAIGYSVAGVTTIVGSTEIFLCHHGASDNAGMFIISNESVTVKTFLVMDFRSGAAVNDIEWFGVFASCGRIDAATAPVMRWTGGVINVEVLRY